jgi:hypothetical protein
MTTMRDVVAGAYRRLGLVPLGQNLDAARAAAGMEALNDLIASWAAQGIAIGVALPLSLSDNWPLDPMHVQGVKAILAVALASNSGIEASPSVQREAKAGWTTLASQYLATPEAAEDQGLIWLSSLRRQGLQ